jgi:hypothetical protein
MNAKGYLNTSLRLYFGAFFLFSVGFRTLPINVTSLRNQRLQYDEVTPECRNLRENRGWAVSCS